MGVIHPAGSQERPAASALCRRAMGAPVEENEGLAAACAVAAPIPRQKRKEPAVVSLSLRTKRGKWGARRTRCRWYLAPEEENGHAASGPQRGNWGHALLPALKCPCHGRGEGGRGGMNTPAAASAVVIAARPGRQKKCSIWVCCCGHSRARPRDDEAGPAARFAVSCRYRPQQLSRRSGNTPGLPEPAA